MKISVSLNASDAELLDDYVKRTDASSRSEAVRHALQLLRRSQLESSYESAWEEMAQDGEADPWESTVGDGLSDAAR